MMLGPDDQAARPGVRRGHGAGLSARPQLASSHTISVLVDNEPGILARVIGLFSGRGYNIESLTVAEADAPENLSRITIVTTGTPMVIEQIKAQLDRLVPVHKVHDLTVEGPHVERELALVKVRGTGEKRVEALRLADVFRARVVDATIDSLRLRDDRRDREGRRLHRPDGSRSAWSRSPAPASSPCRAAARRSDRGLRRRPDWAWRSSHLLAVASPGPRPCW